MRGSAKGNGISLALEKALRTLVALCMAFALFPAAGAYAITAGQEDEEAQQLEQAQGSAAEDETATLEDAASQEASESEVSQARPASLAATPQDEVANLTISTEDELFAFAAAVNAGNTYEGQLVVLDADITLTKQWTPIGDGTYNSYVRASFAGTFDGQGHAVSNVTVDNQNGSTDYSWQGFFGRVHGDSSSHAVVKNLTIRGFVSTVWNNGGGIAGYGWYADFINCGNEANVIAKSAAGGICAEAYACTFTGCYNYGNITQTAYASSNLSAGAGGIAGYITNSTGSVSNCYNWGAVAAGSNAGGLVGLWYANTSNANTQVSNCYNAGTVCGYDDPDDGYTPSPNVGGLVGRIFAYNATDFTAANTMTNCYSSTAVENLVGMGSTYAATTSCELKESADMKTATFAETLGGQYSAVEGSYPMLTWQDASGAATYNLSDATFDPIADCTYNASAQMPVPAVYYNGGPLVLNQDFTVGYANNTNAGTATVTVYGMGDYIGSRTLSFTILPRDVSDGSIADLGTVVFHLPAAMPTIELTVDSIVLEEDTDYELSYANNTVLRDAVDANPPTVTATGMGNYTGTVSAAFSIEACNISTLALNSIEDQTYTGQAIEPGITLLDGSEQLVEDRDYTLKYENNTNEGVATVHVTGMGNYTGTRDTSFTIALPNIISTEAELVSFRDSVNSGVNYTGHTVLLASDIELTEQWTVPIGTSSHPFTGTFNGNNYKITGLDVNMADGYAGLFGKNTGTIKNLGVSGTVTSTDTTGSEEGMDIDFVGGVVGYNAGTVERVSANVEVDAEWLYSVGGIAGRNDGTITECESLNAIYGYRYIGGIAGTNYGSVLKCMNSGSIASSYDYGQLCVGGIAGRNGDADYEQQNAVVDSCYNVGVVGVGNYYNGYRCEGGIAGYCNGYATVTNCYNAGIIEQGYSQYGPIVGGFDYYYTYSNNYSLEGLNSVSSSELVRGIVKTADEMKDEAFVTALNGDPSSGAFVAQTNGCPRLYWQSSSPTVQLDFTKATVEAIPEQEATGEALRPPVTVTYNATLLTENVDYTVAYSNNYNAGTATVTLTGINAYYGTLTTTFTIVAGEEKTLYISTEEELIAFRDKVNAGFNYSNYTVRLENDIVLTQTWIPIGVYDSTGRHAFAGVFDGQGHTIGNVNMNVSEGGFYALFAYVVGTADDRATIKNVIVDGDIVDTREATDSRFSSGGVAGIVGSGDYLDIANCANKANISGRGCVAGIVSYLGYGGSTVTACHNYGTIICDAADTDYSRTSGRYAGGIIAYLMTNNTIESCYNTGDISSTAYAGGIAGYWYPSISSSEFVSMSNCYNIGTISGIEVAGALEAGYYCGGLVGGVSGYGNASTSKNYNTIVNCYSSNLKCDKLFGDGNTSGFVGVDELSCLMDESDMYAYSFVDTLGATMYRASASSTPMLFWEAESVLNVLVDDIDDQEYTGAAIEPAVVVRDGDAILEKDVDYKLSFANNIDVGMATVVIEGIGAYEGVFGESFRILPVDVTVTPVAAKKSFGKQDPAFEATANGLKGSDALSSYTITRSEGEAMGDYETYIDANSVVIKRAGVDVTANYIVSVEPGTFSIGGSMVLSGDDRYATANAVVLETYEQADGVIIACGEDFPDALAAASLAGALDYPVLLAAYDALSADTVAVIEQLGADKAIIVGGTAAISTRVERQLTALMGTNNVERVAGETRYETAVAVYEYGLIAGKGNASVWKDGAFILASGVSFADTLAISPYAAGDKIPVLLANDEGTFGNSDTQQALSGASEVYICGGTERVSETTEAALDAKAGQVVRLAGETRYETSAAVASYLVNQKGYSYNNAAVTSGENFPDALAGAPRQGKNKAVMLLVSDDALAGVTEIVKANADSIDTLCYLGGDAAVSETVRYAIDAAAGF